MRFDIETKIFPNRPGDTLGPEAFVNTLLAAIREAGMERRVMVESFDWQTLQMIHKLAPSIDTAAVKSAQQLGLKVIRWTVNQPADIDRLIGWGVDGVVSDYPDRLREAMRRAARPLPAGLKN